MKRRNQKITIATIILTNILLLSLFIVPFGLSYSKLADDDEDDLKQTDITSVFDESDPPESFDEAAQLLEDLFSSMEDVSSPDCVDMIKFGYTDNGDSYDLEIKVVDSSDTPSTLNYSYIFMLSFEKDNIGVTISGEGTNYDAEGGFNSSYESGNVNYDEPSNTITIQNLSKELFGGNDLSSFNYAVLLGLIKIEGTSQIIILDQLNSFNYDWDEMFSFVFEEYLGEEFVGENGGLLGGLFDFWMNIPDYFGESFANNIYNLFDSLWELFLPPILAMLIFPFLWSALIKMLTDLEKHSWTFRIAIGIGFVYETVEIFTKIATMDYSEVLCLINMIVLLCLEVWMINNVVDYYVTFMTLKSRNWLFYTGWGLTLSLSVPLISVLTFLKYFTFSTNIVVMIVGIIIVFITSTLAIKIMEAFSVKKLKTHTKKKKKTPKKSKTKS